MKTKDQAKYLFTRNLPVSSCYYHLTSVQDTHGNTTSLTYQELTTNSLLVVSRVTDASGRYLTLNWRKHTSSGIQARLESVVDPKGNTWNIEYHSDSESDERWGQIKRILFPAANSGDDRYYLRFTYESPVPGIPAAFRIKTISVPKNNDDAGELTWTYTYHPASLDPWGFYAVDRVDGPDGGNGEPSSTELQYESVYLGTTNDYHLKATIRDPLAATKYHREVHLYDAGDGSNGHAALPILGGPVIHYVVGSADHDDHGDSGYDPAMSAYDGCYYTRYEWDIVDDGAYDGCLTRTTDTLGRSWEYKWYSDSSQDTDNRLNLWKITDPNGEQTKYKYNSQNRMTEQTDPCGHVVTNDYYANTYDLWKTHVDPNDSSHPNGLLNLTTIYEYDSYGNPTKVTDPSGHQVQTDYDSTYHCYPTKQTDLQTGVFSEAHFDELGRKTWTKAARNSSGTVLQTDYDYDALGRLKRVGNPDGTEVLSTYDVCGNLLQSQDENGNIGKYKYDNFGHVSEQSSYARLSGNTTDVLVTTKHVYDHLGRLSSTQWKRDGATKEISYTYNDRNQLVKEDLPGSKPDWIKYQYDGPGRVIKREDGDGTTVRRTTEQSYDPVGRPDEQKVDGTVLADRSYFDDGSPKKVLGPNGTIEYTYDSGDRLDTCYQSYVGKTVQYEYSTSPEKKWVRVREGQGKTGALLGTYVYDNSLSGVSDGNLHFLTSPAGPVTQYRYDYEFPGAAYGLLSRVNYNTLAAAPFTAYQYDTTAKKRFWMSSMANCRSDGSTISSYNHDYDNAGNITRITEADGDHTQYSYDGSYTLLSEARRNVANGLIYSYDYEYDEAGNRKKKILTNANGTSTYVSSYIDNNLLDSTTGPTSSGFSHDYFGNLTSRVTSGQIWSYTYDVRNQLTEARLGGSVQLSAKYDALQRRIERTASGSTTRCLYDGDALIAELDAANAINVWYTPGICESRLSGPGVWDTYYYSVDHQGSTHELLDSYQRVVDAYAHSAYGEELGRMRDPSSAPKNPRRYVGKSGYYTDDETGLMLLGVRYYDPYIGRFITQDPSRDGLNWYEYAGSNPVNRIDPSGMEWSWKALKDNSRQLALDIWTWPERNIAYDDPMAALAPLDVPVVLTEGACSYVAARISASRLGPLLERGGSAVGRAGRAVWRLVADESGKVPTPAPLRSADELIEVHHKLVLQFKANFEAAGLDVELPEFKEAVARGAHRLKPGGMHTGPNNVNKLWRVFFAENPEANRAQIIEHANWIDRMKPWQK